MKITDEQKLKIQKHFASTPPTGGWKCSFCGNSAWEVLDKIYELREFNEGTLVIGGTIIPLISIICTTCGQELFFNAYKLGLIQKDTVKENSK